ncbi:MAG: hypothetical protein ABII13_04270 [Patescibacteria group bacterium]|nr:hypothetical protein [Patescibacteria group bacterium]MBU2509376.1 hypothetical protein [Patescibacteria group bacterium]
MPKEQIPSAENLGTEQPIVERGDRTPKLKSKTFEQLLQFGDAVRRVKELIDEGGKAQLSDAEKVTDEFDFGPRQKESFLKGVRLLLERRQTTQAVKQSYQERFGEQYASELFKELFSASDTFGKVDLYPDDTNLIFVCDDALDVAQAIQPGVDIFQEMGALAGPEAEEIREEIGRQVPMGAFFIRSKQLGEGMTVESAIIINGKEAKAREVDLESVVRHESQHAENSLYCRPLVDTFLSSGAAIKDIAASLGEGDRSIKEVQSKDEDAQIAFVNKLIEKLHKQLDAFYKKLEKSGVEATVKEELLAFYLSGTQNSEIEDIFTLYINGAKESFITACTGLDILLSRMPPNILKTLAINPGALKSRVMFADLAKVAGRLANTNAESDDPAEALRIEFAKKLSGLSGKWNEAMKNGLDILKSVDEYDTSHQTKLRETLLPLLISQPLERWEWIVSSAIKESVK